jgi:hypothetical protein
MFGSGRITRHSENAPSGPEPAEGSSREAPSSETILTVGNPLMSITQLVASLEQAARQPGLTDDARERALPNGIVQRNRNRYRRTVDPLLHDSVAAVLPDCGESILLKNATNLSSR